MRLGAIPDSKIPKKESRLNQNWKRDSASERAKWHSWSANRHMASADRHFPSADWHKVEARPESFLIKIKPIFF